MNKGRFITFEGIEGSGKSTQIKKLENYFFKHNISYLITKEPGGTDLGHKIRQILLSTETSFEGKYSELLLFYVDRLENVAKNIRPALAAGKIVVCDRYIDSSLAYQVGGRQMPLELVQRLNILVDLQPDLTLLFDIDPKVGLLRASKRSVKDRFEQEDLSFHTRIRNAYLAQAEIEPDRIKVIDVLDRTSDNIFEEILSLII